MWKSIFEGAQKKIKCTHKQCHGGRGHDRDEEMGGNDDHEMSGGDEVRGRSNGGWCASEWWPRRKGDEDWNFQIYYAGELLFSIKTFLLTNKFQHLL